MRGTLMNNNAEYGYLRKHISATLLGSYKGLGGS